MCPELSYNHQASTENVAEKFVSQRRPAVKAEGGAPACVRLLNRGLQSLNEARAQVWERGGSLRDN